MKLHALFLALGMVAGALLPAGAAAQAFPSKPITLVVPFPPGGSQDTMARLIGKRLQEELGQPVIVQNKPGGGGGIGALQVAKAPPDGHTLLVSSNGPLNIVPALYKNAGYTLKDFAGVAMIFTAPFYLLVPANSPFKTIQDLIARGRQQQQAPLMYGSTGSGNMSHLASEMINAAAGTRFVHVPYKGGAPLTLSLITGETQWALQQSVDAKPQVDAGKLRPLAVLSTKRSEPWPNVPTMQELGIAGLETESWSGWVAPAQTPAPVLALLNRTIVKILQEPEIANKLRDAGAQAGMPNNTPDGFMQVLQKETALFAKVIRDNDVKAD